MEVGPIRIGGLAAGLALLLTAGCSSGISADGPFGKSVSGGGSECIPVPRNGVGTFATVALGNSSGPARITSVTLVGAHHLKIVAAWVIPIRGLGLMGVFSGYPAGPPAAQAPGIQWARRRRADGALIPHLPGQAVYNLVLVLRPSGAQGTASSEDVNYQSGGTQYLLNLGIGIQLINGNQNGC
jgi:hypothetical protein